MEARILQNYRLNCVVRQILYKVGRYDAEEELDALIEGREYKPSPVHIHGDYVVNKHVDNEIYKYPVEKWQSLGAAQRVLLLVEKLRKELKL